MGLFDFFKKKPEEKVVQIGTPSNSKNRTWRDDNGQINCPGDNCSLECDTNCPIFCQTLGLQLLAFNNANDSIPHFKNAICIAPHFKDAWVNLGVAYGTLNNHIEANKAFRAAFAIDHNYANAVSGIITSCKNLGQYDEALDFCNIYERLKGKSEADEFRSSIYKAKADKLYNRQETDIDMAIKLIATSRRIKMLGDNDRMPHVPELFAEKNVVSAKIYTELIKLNEGKHPVVMLTMSFYAGVGAATHWHIDWEKLKSTGIAETLIEPRGMFYMDEYVMEDCLGYKMDSEEAKDLIKSIKSVSNYAIIKYWNNGNNSKENLLELMNAMYILGLVFELEQLGFK